MSDQIFGNEKKGSIRDIPLPGSSQGVRINRVSPRQNPEDVKGWNEMKRKNKRFLPKIIAIVIALIILFFVASSLLHKATVVISLNEYETTINQGFVAGDTEESDLSLVSLDEIDASVSLFVPGTEEENVQTKASGKIRVENNHSSSQKRYIKNTRFQTPDGRVYRTPTSFVVPGKSGGTPGSIEIVVVADVSGEEYNEESGLTFKLPGLANAGDVYDLVTAAQIEPITGGFSGIVKTASNEDIVIAEEQIRNDLEILLNTRFDAETPAGYIVTDDLVRLGDPVITRSFDQEEGGITVDGTQVLNAVAFEKEGFEEAVAERVIPGYKKDGVDISNLEDLQINVVLPDESITEIDEISFSLVGTVNFVWQVPQNIKTLLAGKKASIVENGLVPEFDQFSSSVDVSVSPFWRGSIPAEENNIEVQISRND